MKVSATALLPDDHAGQAASVLRARLQQVLGHDPVAPAPDWDTFLMGSPEPVRDDRGATWFRWAATVETVDAIEVRRPTVNDLGLLGVPKGPARR